MNRSFAFVFALVLLFIGRSGRSAEQCLPQDISSRAADDGWDIPVADCPTPASPALPAEPRPLLVTPQRMLVSAGAPLRSPSHRHPAGGDPVLGDGEFFEQRADAALGGEGVTFQFQRTYRSGVRLNGPLGGGWDHNYDQRLLRSGHSDTVAPDCEGAIDFQDGQLNVMHFVPDSLGSAAAGHPVWRANGTGLTLQSVAGGWKMTASDGSWRLFDSRGYLGRSVDVIGNGLTFTWENLTTSNYYQRLATVSDGVHVVHYVYRPNLDLLQCISLGTDCGNESVRPAEVLAYFMYTSGNQLQMVLHGQDVMGERIVYLTAGAFANQYGPSDCMPNNRLASACHQLCDANDPTIIDTCHNLDVANRIEKTCSSVFGCVKCASSTRNCVPFDPTKPLAPSNLDCQVYNYPDTGQPDSLCMQAYGTAPACLTSCLQSHQCFMTAGSQAFYSFGVAEDLAYDITDIFDEHGVLEVHNEYGQLPWDVSFDRVVKQTLGSDGKNVVTFAYHDLAVESGSGAAVYPPVGGTRYSGAASTPDPVDVVPVSTFYENFVCPTTSDCPRAPDGSCLASYGPPSAPLFIISPANAVVITDVHGVTRTQYFDSDYNLIREVNVSAGETTDYSYSGNFLVGVQQPSGVRECYQRDADGRTLQSTTLPAGGYAGTQTPMANATRYDSAGQVTDEWRDIFGVVSKTHYTRDGYHRIATKDVDVASSQPPLHTTYGYDGDTDPVGIRATPSSETLPDGTINDNIRSYDATGHLVRIDYTVDAGSSNPQYRYELFDDRGRTTESGEVDRFALHYQYDTGNRLAVVGHRDNKSAPWLDTSYSWYDEFGTMPSVIAEPKRTTNIDYLNGQPKTIRVDGIPTCKHYDADGRLEAEILPAGNMVEYSYNSDGRIATMAKGYESTPPTDPWAQDCVPKMPPANDPGMVQLQWRWYQIEGFLGAMTDNGVYHSVKDDGFGRIIETDGTTDGAPAAAHQTGYDSRGRVVWSADFAAGTPYGKPIMTQPGLITMTEYDYDLLDRVIAERHWHIETGDILTVTNSYDDKNRSVTRTDRGVSTTTWFDARGRVTNMTAGDGSTTSVAHYLDYDIVTQQTGQPQPLVRTLQHDTRGRVTSILDENNVVLSSVQYDDHDNHLVETTIGAATVIRTFDDFDRLFTEHKDLGNGSSIDAKYERDGNGRVWRYTDSAGKPWLFTYTGLDSPLTTTDPVGRVDSYSYAPGWAPPSGRIDPTGRHRCFRYDMDLRLAYVYDVDCPANSDIRGAAAPLMDRRAYSYTPLGQLARVTVDSKDDAHSVNDYVSDTYDSLGRVVDEQVSSTTSRLAGYVVHHDYPGDGRTTVTQLTGYPTIPPPPPGFQYCDPPPPHGGTGQPMVGKRCIPTPDQPPPFIATFRHSHDGVGRLSTVDLNGNRMATWTWPNGASDPSEIGFGDGTRTTYDYDNRFRMTKATVWQNQAGAPGPNASCPPGDDCVHTHPVAIASVQDAFGADSVVRMRQRIFGAAGAPMTDVYQVDGDARVTGEALAVPNVTMPTGEVNEKTVSNYMGAGSWRYFGLDGNGNWLSTATPTAGAVTQQNDATGQLQSIGTSSMTIDARGNLQQLAGDSLAFRYDDYSGRLTSASNGGVTETYQYDALDRRSVETSGRTQTVVVWDAGRIIAHGDAASIIIDVPGDDIDEHVASVDNNGTGTARFYHQSGDQSVLAITDATGLVEGYSYSAFGDTKVWNGSGASIASSLVGNRFAFQGQWWNAVTSSYAMRARQYVPKWGRFSSSDPLSIAAAPSLFSFTGSRPLSARDPLGLLWVTKTCATQDECEGNGPPEFFDPPWAGDAVGGGGWWPHIGGDNGGGVRVAGTATYDPSQHTTVFSGPGLVACIDCQWVCHGTDCVDQAVVQAGMSWHDVGSEDNTITVAGRTYASGRVYADRSSRLGRIADYIVDHPWKSGMIIVGGALAITTGLGIYGLLTGEIVIGTGAPALAASGSPAAVKAVDVAEEEAAAVEGNPDLLNPDKWDHVFQAKHNLDALVQAYGSQQGAYAAIYNAAQAAVNSSGVSGLLKGLTVNVGGMNISVTGVVIDGVVRIGTAWRVP